ncbi:MAG: hypothetical protein FWD26_04935 [Treponema sp.]|nr:hypothetical protein [Treponema sp.]
MKKKIKYLLILGIAAFLIVLTGCETKPIKMDLDGFFDITWGENISTAASILREKEFIMHLTENSITAYGIFMDEEVWLDLLFYNDRFYIVYISFKNKSKLFEKYNKINDLLTEKYGEPSFISKNNPRIPPLFSTTWEFHNNCTISNYFYPELNSSDITYVNNTIFNEKNN